MPQRQPLNLRKPRPSGARYTKEFRPSRAKLSKMVSERTKSAGALRASILVMKSYLAEGLEEKLGRELCDGERLPDHALSAELVGRRVEAALRRLLEADRRLCRHCAELASLRREADQMARKELYPRARDVRRSIDAVFGKPHGVLIHGIVGRLYRKPRRQIPQVERMVLRLRGLRDGESEMPEPKVSGYHAEHDAWLRQVEPLFVKLEDFERRIYEAESERSHLLVTKQKAMEEFDAVLSEARRFLEGAYLLAGLDERARKSLRSYADRRLLKRLAREQHSRRKRKAEAEAELTEAVKAPAQGGRGWRRSLRELWAIWGRHKAA